MKNIKYYFEWYIPFGQTTLFGISLAKVIFVDEIKIILHLKKTSCYGHTSDKWKNITLLKWKKERENLSDEI